jgi:hypothetical protein
MKQRVLHVLVMALLLSAVGAVPSSGTDAGRKVTGGMGWWFPEGRGWVELNIQEVGPGEAKGWVNLKEYDELLGWRRWKGRAICVAFDVLDGEPAAAFVVQIERFSGWGYPGEAAGQYVKLWGIDGGTPAAAGDWAGLIVFPPVDEQPSCEYELPWAAWPLNSGNMVIHW